MAHYVDLLFWVLACIVMLSCVSVALGYFASGLLVWWRARRQHGTD